MEVRVGTSGYSYKQWKGPFYPEDLKDSAMLSYYGTKLATVEINNTFYRMPKKAVLEKWCSEVPETFRFVLKASQRITHRSRLKDAGEATSFFCERAGALGDKLGPVLFQLPPNFKKDSGRLTDLLVQLPTGLRCAFEFRHDSWFSDDVYDLLRSRNAALCIADTEDGATPSVATADFGYLRLRAVDYSEDDLKKWVETIEGVGAHWRETFVFFKHEESATGPALAQRLQQLLNN